MKPSDFALGFRVLGSPTGARRLVDAAAAILAHCSCDPRAELHLESYLSVFQFGQDFRVHLAATGSPKGFVGACWAPWLWLDIDRADDLDAALRDTRRLAAFIAERYGRDGEELLLFFSGSKGFHVGLPTSLFGEAARPSTMFHQQCRRLAERLAAEGRVMIDSGVYDRVRLFRAPNSRHPKTGRHKRGLAYDELMSLSAVAIATLASEPAAFDLSSPVPANERAIADWSEVGEAIAEQAAALAQRRVATGEAAKLNRLTLQFIREGAGEGDRHRVLYSAARNLGEAGAPLDLASQLLSEAALDSGLPPRDVRRQVECGWRDSQSRKDSA